MLACDLPISNAMKILKKIDDVRVLVVGVGGLGCEVARLLAAQGLRHIGLIDGDVVENDNIGRQILFDRSMIGENKATVAAQTLTRLFNGLSLVTYDCYLSEENAALIGGYDIIIDAVDSFETELLINDTCSRYEKPFIYGAVQEFMGQVAVFIPSRSTVSIRCVFDETAAASSRDVRGVPLALSAVASLQAAACLRYIGGADENGIMKEIDSLNGSQREFVINLCADHSSHL